MVRRPKYQAPARDGQRWLISYTDVLTLLLILFIAVAAQSAGQSQAKVEAAASAKPAPVAPPALPPQPIVPPTPNVPPTGAPPPSPSHEALHRAEELLKARGLDAKQEARGLVISLPQAVLFGSGDDRINTSARPIISEIANAVRDLDN
ncbi:MAG TPA: flagellar motor protein MotB, partial [Bryobacteraceae bacterium]|nr:flagellar motor protein MotB [Bryobacteraceae bacterium]